MRVQRCEVLNLIGLVITRGTCMGGHERTHEANSHLKGKKSLETDQKYPKSTKN